MVATLPMLELVVPTSVSTSAGTASVSATGKVTYSGSDGLTVNGCFTATYDNYLIVQDTDVSSSNPEGLLRLASGGTPVTAANYSHEFINANNTSVGVQRDYSSTTWWYHILYDDDLTNGGLTYVYAPFLAQQTAFRCISANSYSNARITETSGTHSLSTSYDGFHLTCLVASTLSGSLTVYGFTK